MIDENLLYLVLLHSVGINQTKLNIIFDKNSDYKDFFLDKINHKYLGKYYKVDQIDNILTRKAKINIEFIKNKLISRDIKIITKFDESYPTSLSHIFNPPFFIYLRGNIPTNKRFLSIVGSRKYTQYAKRVLHNFMGDLSKNFCIVSGGAIGVDSEAHKQALAFATPTLAIIGTGIDVDYPATNKSLYDEIVAESGGVISIFPLGEAPNQYNFPIRNELIAGLGDGLLVVEAAKKSGTLITVSLALDMGKDIFAIPGDIFLPNSSGTNNLIKTGQALAIMEANDILQFFGIKSNDSIKNEISFDSSVEKEIFDLLRVGSCFADILREKLKKDIQEISLTLMMMELKQILTKNERGEYYLV